MKKFILCFLLTAHCFSQDIWVMGKTYLLHSENGKHFVLKNKMAESWGYDKTNCRLWVTEKNILYSMDRKKRTQRGEAQKILTDLTDSFLTLSLDGKIESRDEQGRVLATYLAPWKKLPVSVGKTKDFVFALIESDNTLTTYKKDFTLVRETLISEKRDFWNLPKLVVNEKTATIWIGYTVTQTWTLYAPVLEKRNFKGELLYKKEWQERGILFDLCLEANGDALVSRDVPSNSGYTVPVHSYLERISLTQKEETVFSHQENLFIDSLSCQKNEIAFISRSIFGSDGSTVEIWDKTHEKFSKTLVKLPDPAWKIYSCHID